MDDDAPLAWLADPAASPAPSAETLRSIVGRYRRRRARALGVALVVALVVGPVAGWAVGRSGGRATTRQVVVAAGGPEDMHLRVDAVNGMVPALGPSGSDLAGPAPPVPSTRLFLRTTADAVRIRAYLVRFGGPANADDPHAQCRPVQMLNAEFSDDLVASSNTSSVWAGVPVPDPLTVISVQTGGFMEGSPIWITSLLVAPGVAMVRAHFADGSTDEMTPSQGWAVLAHHAPAAVRPAAASGTVDALDAGGKVLGSATLNQNHNRMPDACLPPRPSPPTTAP